VDAAYEELYGFLRPGVRENECVGLVSKVLYDLGSEYVEGVNAISGERCAPHPHVYSDRIIRPGDPAFFDILHSHLGYRTCYSRLVSLDHPEVLEEGMVFALETYWPAADGWSAARIEEEVVVTANGCEVITKFPAEELLVAGRKYWTAGGQLSTTREAQSNLNTGKAELDEGGPR